MYNKLVEEYDFLQKEDDDILDLTGCNEQEYINILIAHYNKTNGKITGIFDQIDYDQLDSTNKCMEFIYDQVEIYNSLVKSDDSKTDLIPYKDKSNDVRLIILSINNIKLYACEILFPLILYLATKDWENIIWSIDYEQP
jgi:flagellar capping protein FliD